ncbi:MAG: hypothetical protein AAF849_06295 [Bacteroidota bacterium]
MKNYFILSLLIFGWIPNIQAQMDQDSLPYYQIPDTPEVYHAGTVIARMIDGLGFRYYWATEGLRTEDLAFKPNEDARTTDYTLDHIHGLCRVVLNTAKKVPHEASSANSNLSFAKKRQQTLLMLKEASDIFRSSDPDTIEDFEIIFKRGKSESVVPLWNLINGPIADAIWHVGQIVSFRRSSGNPMDSRVSVFQGKLRKP